MDNIYPPFLAKFVNENGKLSKEWHPFFNELYEMLKGVKSGSSGNLVSIDSLNRLGDSDVLATAKEIFSAYDEVGDNELTSGAWADLPWDKDSQESDDFEHPDDDSDIKCLFTGTLKLTYHVTAYVSSHTDNTTIQTKAQYYRYSWEDIDGTLSEGYHRAADTRSNLSGKRIMSVRNKDRIKIVGSVTSGNSTILTVANACSITIERLT